MRSMSIVSIAAWLYDFIHYILTLLIMNMIKIMIMQM